MVFEKIREIIAEQTGKDESEITLETNVKEDLDADSLDLFQIINDIEDEFDVSVENPEEIVTLNDLLHAAGNYILGRMGIPYREKGINIISIAIDAPQDMISSLSGKIGRLKGVSAKTAYSNIITKAEAQND